MMVGIGLVRDVARGILTPLANQVQHLAAKLGDTTIELFQGCDCPKSWIDEASTNAMIIETMCKLGALQLCCALPQSVSLGVARWW